MPRQGLEVASPSITAWFMAEDKKPCMLAIVFPENPSADNRFTQPETWVRLRIEIGRSKSSAMELATNALYPLLVPPVTPVNCSIWLAR